MKKPVIIGVSALVLLASATLLFAQTATGSSLITQMKATVHSFNLLADLNGTVTNPSDYISSPVIGKKTGDMLTAGEWNRVLELVAQGGGGGGAGFEINDATTKTRYSIIWNGISWANNPKHLGGLGGDSTGLANCGTYFAGTLTPNCKMIETAAHDFCQIVFAGGAVTHSELNYIGAKKWRIITSGFGNFTSGTIVECYNNVGGGTGGGGTGGAGWVDVPTTDTADFDLSCIYRMIATGSDIAGGSNMRYAVGVQAGQLFFGFNLNPGWIGGYIAKGTKATFSTNSNGTFVVSKLEKLCAGAGSGGGGFNWDACTPEWVGTPRDGTPYTNAAGLKCKYTGSSGPSSLDQSYYLCCPAGGGGTTTPPPAAAPACTVRAFSLACSNQAPNYSCENARNNCQAQVGYISANDDGNGVNRHIDCTVCQ